MSVRVRPSAPSNSLIMKGLRPRHERGLQALFPLPNRVLLQCCSEACATRRSGSELMGALLAQASPEAGKASGPDRPGCELRLRCLLGTCADHLHLRVPMPSAACALEPGRSVPSRLRSGTPGSLAWMWPCRTSRPAPSVVSTSSGCLDSWRRTESSVDFHLRVVPSAPLFRVPRPCTARHGGLSTRGPRGTHLEMGEEDEP